MNIETKAFVSIVLNPDKIDGATLKDVKEWVAKVESFGYGDDTVVEECLLSLWVESSNVAPILCGNHYANEPERNDILVGTHEC